MRSSNRKASLWAAIFLVLAAFFSIYFFSVIHLVVYRYGDIAYSDFSYHLIMVRAFWFDDIHRIYSPNAQIEVLRQNFGPELTEAMPLGILPSTLTLWLPFAALGSFEIATGVWCGLSFALILFALFESVPENAERRTLAVVALAAFPLVLPLGVRTILLGQTPLFSGALLVFLVGTLVSDERRSARAALLAVLLSLKPTYAVFAFGALAAAKDWRALSTAACGLAILSLVPAIVAGPEIYTDYFRALRVYSAGYVPDYYRHAIHPETMQLFSSAFAPYLGRPAAASASSLLYVALSVVVVCAAARSGAGTATRVFLSVYLLVATMLLFAPYAGVYEDMLLVALSALLLVRAEADARLRAAIFSLAGFAAYTYVAVISGAHVFVWLFKLAVLAAGFGVLRASRG